MRKLLLSVCIGAFVSLPVFAADNPDAARTNAQLGLAYLAKGYYPQSKDRLLQAIQEDPKLASVWYSMAYYLEKTGDKRAAKAYYEKALSVDPHSGEAKNNYGTFLCRNKDYESALRYFDSAVKEPSYLDDASAYQNAGTCSLMMHNKPLAKRYFQAALDNNPNMPFALLSLARLYNELGNRAAANRYFEDFRKIALANKSDAVVARYKEYVYSKNQPVRLPMP